MPKGERKEFAVKRGEAQGSAKSGTKNLKLSNPKGSPLRQRRTGAVGGRGVGEISPVEPREFRSDIFKQTPPKTHRSSRCVFLRHGSCVVVKKER
jgi:hypothetical protein